MDVVALKNELDNLNAAFVKKYNWSKDFLEWHSPGVSDEDIAAAEKRLGVALPQEVKQVCKVFSGVYFDMPYHAPEKFSEVREKMAIIVSAEDAAELDDEQMTSDLSIKILPVDKWGVVDPLWNPKEEYCKVLAGPGDDDEDEYDPGQGVYCGCEEGIVQDEFFIHIGYASNGDIFMDLNAGSSNYGALYHISPANDYSYLLVYKIADNYLDFLERYKTSLEIELQSPLEEDE